MAVADIRIELTDQPCQGDVQQIHEGIKAFNNEISIHHREGRNAGAITPLYLFVRDAQGTLMGGLTASSFWGWLAIDDLWLDESIRGQDIGTELMQRAEVEAIRRGCNSAQLSTFSFQARAFYEKLGYRVIGALEDYPPGETFFWMRKDFSEAERDISEVGS